MLKEFVESIVKLAKEGIEPSLTQLPGGRALLVTPEGEEQIAVDRKTHTDSLVSFASVLLWCHAFDEKVLVIGVSDTQIGVSSNREFPHECDQAVMRLRHSAAYADLLDWCKNPRSTRQVVHGLRSKLYETFDPSYLAIFKRLDFSRKNDGTKTVSHTGESMGRSVEMAAQSGAGDIPDTLLFTIDLFDGLPVDHFDLRFAVTVDPASETVAIAPVGDCIASAHSGTRIDLVARLKTEFLEALVLETA